MQVRCFRLTAPVVLGMCVWQFPAHAAPPAGGNLPLSKGTYWVYRGTLRGHESQANCDSPPVTRNVTWRMEVVDTLDRGDVSAAVIAGDLVDLMNADVEHDRINIRRTESLLIWGHDEKYYRFEDRDMRIALKRLKDPADSLSGLIQNRGPEFDLPLSRGKVFGDPEQIAMHKKEIESRQIDGMGWLYVVDKVSNVSLTGIEGITAPNRVQRYQLRYVTNSSLRTMGFVHGIGITDFSFDYHPAGCLMLNTNVKLTEYHHIRRRQQH